MNRSFYSLLYRSRKIFKLQLWVALLFSPVVFFLLFNVISSSKQGLFILGSVSFPLVMTFRCICGVLFSEEDLRRPCYKYGFTTTSTAGANQHDAARAQGYWQRLCLELYRRSKEEKGLCTIG